MPFAPKRSRLRRIQGTALVFLLASGCVNYMDRSALAIANPLIRHDLGLSLGEMGLLLSAFLWSYAFAQLPAGAMIDRFGPRRLLAVGLLVWSVAQGVAGLVTSFGQFFVARLFLGVGEAPQFPTGARVVRDWFAVRDRGLATGIFNAASTLGAAVAPPILTVLMLGLSWRWMFGIMGIAGVVVAIMWFALYRDPRQSRLTESERRHIAEGDVTGEAPRVTFAEWAALFRFRTTWAMMLGFFGCIYMTWIYMTWLPGYLEIQRHMSIPHTGLISSIPYAFGVVGSIIGGWIADLLVRRGTSPINSRKIPIVISLAGMAGFTILAALTPSTTIAVASISAAMFLGYVCSATAWALASVAGPANVTASLGSIQNFGGYFGGALAPAITGFIAQTTGSFTAALLIGAGIGLFSAAIYLFLLQRPIANDELVAASGLAPVPTALS